MDEKIISTLQKAWEKNLKSEGVKFPIIQKLIELACLYSFMPNPQVDIKKWHEKFNKEYIYFKKTLLSRYGLVH